MILAIVTVLLFGFDADVKSVNDDKSAAADSSKIIVVRNVIADQNCVRILKADKMLTPEDCNKIQKYLIITGKDSIVIQSPPDNIPILVPNTSKYSMPAVATDASKYYMPIIRPQIHNERNYIERKRK